MCSMLQNLDNKCGRINSRSSLAGASQQATRVETIWYSLYLYGLWYNKPSPSSYLLQGKVVCIKAMTCEAQGAIERDIE